MGKESGSPRNLKADKGSPGRLFSSTVFFVLLFLSLIFFLFVFLQFQVSPADFGKFLLGLLIIVYLPGRSLLWLSRFQGPRLEGLALALGLGMGASTLVNKYSRLFHTEFVFGLWLLAAAGFFVYRVVRNPPRKAHFQFRLTSTGLIFMAILFLVFLMLFVDSYRNGLEQPDGSILVRMHYYDGFIRNAVIREVSHSVPPQMPFAAGIPLSYHYGMDLFVSMFNRYLGLGVFDLNHRLLMTFFLALLALAAFIFIRETFSSEKTALLGTFLILFGSGGLSYVALLFFRQSIATNVFHSFYLFDFLGINSFVPALALFFLGSFCLVRVLRHSTLGGLVLTGLFFSCVAEFKVFLIAPVIGVLLLAAVVMLIRFRDRSFLRILAVTVILTSPLFLTAFITNQGGPPYKFRLRFVDWISPTIETLKSISLQKGWDSLVHSGHSSLILLAAFLGCGLLYLLGACGLSLLALPSMVKKSFSGGKDSQGQFFLIGLFAASVGYYFFLHVRLGDVPLNILNIYVFYLGLVLLLVFWADRVIRFIAPKKTTIKIGVLSVLIGLSLPNSVNFLWVKTHAPDSRVFSKEFSAVARWLHGQTAAESVILHPQELRYLCYFAGRRVVLDRVIHSYLRFHLLRSEIKQRTGDIDRFFKDPELSGDVLEKYGVNFVAVSESQDDFPRTETSPPLTCYLSLGTASPEKYQESHRLGLAFRNANFAVFRVERVPEQESKVFILEKSGTERRLIEFSPSYKNPR